MVKKIASLKSSQRTKVIFYLKVCAVSWVCFNEHVAKKYSHELIPIHLCKEPISLTIGMYIKDRNDEKRKSYLKEFKTCWNSIWQLTFLDSKTRGSENKNKLVKRNIKTERKIQTLKSFKTFSCSLKKVFMLAQQTFDGKTHI